MNLHRALVVALAVLTVLMAATPSYANISDASVLFLRIAPGARAAGMGEAFVAIADDATATHWNPAGLGASPLAGSWNDAQVPQECRPLTAMVAVHGSAGGNGHLAYDVWAIGSKGIMRYDNKEWSTAEIFRTRTDQTVHGIVSKYLNVNDAERLTEAINRVAVANSPMKQDALEAFLRDVLNAAPATFKDTAAFRAASDSLLALYPLCRINWEMIGVARQVWQSVAKDTKLSARDMDRIFGRIEQARNRFIPEELKVPYSAIIPGTPTALSSSGSVVYVGTTNGLVLYNGRTWRSFTEADGLPSNHVTALASMSSTTVIGTAAGAVLYDGVGIARFKDTVGLPADTVFAIAAKRSGGYYAVVHNDLYHYDGLRWSNTLAYTVAVDDTPQAIAAKFSVFGSYAEREKYLEKLSAIPQDVPKIADSVAAVDSLVTKSPFTPGNTVMVPYLAGFKGRVTALAVHADEIWVGTEYGLLFFDKNRWHLPGYRDVTVADGQTLATHSQGVRSGNKTSEDYAVALRDINDLVGDSLTAGQILKVRSATAAGVTAAQVNNIGVHSGRILVATDEGLVEYANGSGTRSDIRGLGTTPTQAVFAFGEELWLATNKNVVTQARSQSEAALMYAKWLPTLASDLYYGFTSIVTHIDGVGTIGFSPTIISYGTFSRTGESSPNVVGTFDSYDAAFAVSYGTSLTGRLKGGISAKIIYSRLSPQGAGAEQGTGTSTGFALDGGILYHHSPRLNLGLAITNIGPKMTYINAAQADPLPTNLAFGFAYKLKQTDYLRWLVTAEGNKLLPNTNGSFSEELREIIWNGGTEIVYANIIAGRLGYIYDQEGQIKTITLGVGLSMLKGFRFDFAYIPSNNDLALANTLRSSLAIVF